MQQLTSTIQKFRTTPTARLLLSVFCAIIGTLGSVTLFKLFSPGSSYLPSITNDLFSCAILFLLFLYYRKPIHFHRRTQIFTIICSILFALILVLGGQLEFFSNIFWNWRTLAKIFGVIFLLYPIFSLVIHQLSQFKLGQFTLQPKKHAFIAFGCIFVITMLVWLLIFPGIYTYDMAAQNEIISKGSAIGEWYSGSWSVAHWSLTYGFLLAGFLDLGQLIFHSYTVGFALAVFAQAIFICYVETRIVLFATKISRSRKVYIGSILFFCLMPFLVVTSLSAAQDVLFAGLFALVVLNLFELIFDKDYLQHKLNYVKLPLLGFFMCTVRNNGVYCLVFLFVFTALFYKRPKRQLLFLLSIPIIAAFIYSGPFMKLLNIQKSTSIQEILGVPSQQLARAYYQEADSFTPAEIDALKRYYDPDRSDFSLYQQHPLIADYTKGSLKTDHVNSDLIGYLGLWLGVGLKNPDEYIEAFLLNSFGYWYPSKNYNDSRLNLDFINYPGYAMTAAFNDQKLHPYMKPIERHSVNNDLATHLDGFIFGNGWLNFPLLATFCAMGTYMILFLFVIGYILAKRQYHLLMPLSLVFGLYLTLLLSPVAIFRYGYPIVILAPLFAALIFAANHRHR